MGIEAPPEGAVFLNNSNTNILEAKGMFDIIGITGGNNDPLGKSVIDMLIAPLANITAESINGMDLNQKINSNNMPENNMKNQALNDNFDGPAGGV